MPELCLQGLGGLISHWPLPVPRQMSWGSWICLEQHGGMKMGTHGCHPAIAALPVCMAAPGLHWHRRFWEVCGDGRWLWPHPGAVLVVGSALPATASTTLGWKEATAQLVPPGRAALASHSSALEGFRAVVNCS